MQDGGYIGVSWGSGRVNIGVWNLECRVFEKSVKQVVGIQVQGSWVQSESMVRLTACGAWVFSRGELGLGLEMERDWTWAWRRHGIESEHNCPHRITSLEGGRCRMGERRGRHKSFLNSHVKWDASQLRGCLESSHQLQSNPENHLSAHGSGV